MLNSPQRRRDHREANSGEPRNVSYVLCSLRLCGETKKSSVFSVPLWRTKNPSVFSVALWPLTLWRVGAREGDIIARRRTDNVVDDRAASAHLHRSSADHCGLRAGARAGAGAQSHEGAGRGDAGRHAGCAAIGRDRAVRRQGPLAVGQPVRRRRAGAVGRRRWRRNGQARQRRHPDEAGVWQLPAPHRVRHAVGRRGQQPGPRQQRRVPDEQLRAASPRLVSEPDLLPRPGGRHLQAARAAREREPEARRVAGLRRRVPRAEVRRRRQADSARDLHGLPQRRPHPGSRRP